MTQKEREAEKKRLIEALIGFPLTDSIKVTGTDCVLVSRRDAEDFADKLIDANGVIVPPCKVGDTVYSIGWLDGSVKEEKILYFIFNSYLNNFVFVTDVGHFDANQIGKFIFLTREAAEQALKESET